MKPLRIAALVKQIPRFQEMQLGPDGRLKRDGVELVAFRLAHVHDRRRLVEHIGRQELVSESGGSCGRDA